jgi:RNA polymerase sigma-70 factor (ECF subfamily)
VVEEIVRRAMVDERELSRLLADLEPFVFRLSYHLTRHQHDAEDLAQEVLAKICTRLASFRGDSTLQTWVYTMVVNTHRDQLRKKKLRQAEELTRDVPAKSFEEESDARLLWQKLLQDLPEVDRHILVLRFQNDLSVREVAEIMNLSESNVKTRCFRMRDRLRGVFVQGGGLL